MLAEYSTCLQFYTYRSRRLQAVAGNTVIAKLEVHTGRVRRKAALVNYHPHTASRGNKRAVNNGWYLILLDLRVNTDIWILGGSNSPSGAPTSRVCSLVA